MRFGRHLPWEIAADLEAAAIAVRAAAKALDRVNNRALADIEMIDGTRYLHSEMADAIQALSDDWQAIADAETDA